METVNSSAAFALVKAALDSKAVTLSGPQGAATPEEAGKKDAAYLIALLSVLVKASPSL